MYTCMQVGICTSISRDGAVGSTVYYERSLKRTSKQPEWINTVDGDAKVRQNRYNYVMIVKS